VQHAGDVVHVENLFGWVKALDSATPAGSLALAAARSTPSPPDRCR
jgi:hypothetical protein